MGVWQVTISGVNRTDYVAVNRARIVRDLNGRSTCSLSLGQRYRSYRPDKGASISASEDGVTRFGGNIVRVVERLQSGAPGLVEFDLECMDYNHICERRFFSGEFAAGTSLYSVVSSVVSVGLSGEGVSVAGVENPGPTISQRLKFELESVSSIFDKLSTITGRYWYIDFSKVLQFATFSGTAAPLSLTDSSANFRDLEVERSDEDYRNRQYVRTEAEIAIEYTETYTVTQTGQDYIPTSVVPLSIVSVTLNGAALTTKEHDTQPPASGYDLYFKPSWMGLYTYGWAVGNPALGLHLVAGDVIAFTYRGASRNVIMVEDTSKQTARAAIEGGSGIHEAVEEQRNLDSYDALRAVGLGRLRQFGTDAVKVRFTTDVSGIRPGMYISIAITAHSLSGSFLITRVDSLIAAPPYGRHVVECTNQEPIGLRSQTYTEKVVEMARIGQVAGGESTTAPEVNTAGFYEIPYGSTITPDCDDGRVQACTLTGPVTVFAPQNSTAGGELTLILTQDGTGGHAIAFDPGFGIPSGFAASLDAGTRTVLSMRFGSGGQVHLTGWPATGL